MEEKERELGKAPNSLIFISLASMYLDNGMVEEAIDLCKSGLEIEPDNEEAHIILARAEIEKGEHAQAGDRLEAILKRNPENATARELLEQIASQAVPAQPTAHPEAQLEEKPKEKPAEKPKEVEEVIPAPEKQGEPAAEVVEETPSTEQESIEEMVLEGEELMGALEKGPSVDDIIEEAIQAASQVTGLIPTEEEEEGAEEVLEAQEDVGTAEKPVPSEITETERNTFLEKMERLLQMDGIISCFFRLKDGGIVKHPRLLGNVDDLIPLLDALLGTVKAAAGRLEMGVLELLMIEIEKGVFYIYSKRDFDCFLISKSIDNFGFVKVMVPRVLDDLSPET